MDIESRNKRREKMGQKKYLKELWPNFSQIWWKTLMNRPYKFSNFQENKYKWNQIYSHHSHAAKNQSKQKKTLEAPRGKRHVMYKRKKKGTIDSSLETMEVRREKESPYLKNWNLGKGKGNRGKDCPQRTLSLVNIFQGLHRWLSGK